MSNLNFSTLKKKYIYTLSAINNTRILPIVPLCPPRSQMTKIFANSKKSGMRLGKQARRSGSSGTNASTNYAKQLVKSNARFSRRSSRNSMHSVQITTKSVARWIRCTRGGSTSLASMTTTTTVATMAATAPKHMC